MPKKLKAIAKTFKEAFLGRSWENEKPEWIDQLPAEGEDVVPPWIQYPDLEPWWRGWGQGNSQGWFNRWFDFWYSLTYEEHQAYIERWPPPSDDWRTWMNMRLKDK